MKMKAKILKTEIAEDGQVMITVKITDNKGFSWFKVYNYYTTQKIKLSDFRSRIRGDLQKDLKVTAQLDELKPEVGKEFTITI